MQYIKKYLIDEFEKYLELLEREDEKYKILLQEDDQYSEISSLIDIVESKEQDPKILKFISCFGLIVQIASLNTATYLTVLWFAFWVLCCSPFIYPTYTYYKAKKKLKEENFDMESLEYQKQDELDPLRRCMRRIKEYKEALTILSEIILSDDLAKALEDYREYSFVQEALKNEYASYLQEISLVNPSDVHYKKSAAPEVKFDQEKQLIKSISSYE